MCHTFGMETWLPIPGYEGLYEVSDLGNIRTVRLLMQTRSTKTGRPLLQLWKGGKGKMFSPHKLVLLAFKGPPAEGQMGLHNDGDPWNNRVENLRWGTCKENYADAVKHGTQGKGEACARAILTEEIALKIFSDPRRHKEIAKEYGVTTPTVSAIKTKRNWKHLHSF